jgi:short-subunit dehydrogenase
MPLKIFLTGASSGIGEALALAYSKQDVVLGLFSRRSEKLKSLQKKLRCPSEIYVGDVSKLNNLQKAAQHFIKKFGAPDLVIANAGVSSGTLIEHQDDLAVIKSIFNINVHGAIHTFHPFIKKMKEKRGGHLVAIASVAGIRGLPGAGAYSASKAALINYMESLRVELISEGIHVTTISPGYIKSPMTSINDYPMPFLMETDMAAKKIMRLIKQKKRHVIFPWPMAIIGRLMHILPNVIWDFLAKRGPKKKRHLIK